MQKINIKLINLLLYNVHILRCIYFSIFYSEENVRSFEEGSATWWTSVFCFICCSVGSYAAQYSVIIPPPQSIYLTFSDSDSKKLKILRYPVIRLSSIPQVFLKSPTFTSRCCYWPDEKRHLFLVHTDKQFNFHDLSRLCNKLMACQVDISIADGMLSCNHGAFPCSHKTNQ